MTFFFSTSTETHRESIAKDLKKIRILKIIFKRMNFHFQSINIWSYRLQLPDETATWHATFLSNCSLYKRKCTENSRQASLLLKINVKKQSLASSTKCKLWRRHFSRIWETEMNWFLYCPGFQPIYKHCCQRRGSSDSMNNLAESIPHRCLNSYFAT